jgi:hypothetical protein
MGGEKIKSLKSSPKCCFTGDTQLALMRLTLPKKLFKIMTKSTHVTKQKPIKQFYVPLELITQKRDWSFI